jgi:hypothetical protein
MPEGLSFRDRELAAQDFFTYLAFTIRLNSGAANTLHYFCRNSEQPIAWQALCTACWLSCPRVHDGQCKTIVDSQGSLIVADSILKPILDITGELSARLLQTI